MNYLWVENISKSFGEKLLFKDISFSLNAGDKFALVARNGEGKTSFLRILTGLEIPDSGKVFIQKDTTLGYLSQHEDLDANLSIIETVMDDENDISRAILAYEQVMENPSDTDEYIAQLQKANDDMDSTGAWQYEQKIKTILSQLQLTDTQKKIKFLSGGERKRVSLARLLIKEPNVLILDEPTNHLDIEMVEWLEYYLTSIASALLIVTHDRYFLDRITNNIIELDDKTLYHYKGDYEYYLEKKSDRLFNDSREIDKAQNIYRKELEWVRRMPKARGTKSKSRLDAFTDLEKKAKKRIEDNSIQLEIKMNRIGGKILEVKHLNKAFEGKKMVNGFSFTFSKGDRIGIIGKNGIGKSTFLNMLTGRLTPDSGKVNIGDTTVFGYYLQEGIQVDPTKRVIEVIKEIADIIPTADGGHITASQFLQKFGFKPESQFTPAGKLSGGERRRLLLMTVLMKNPNFLILDEPTNDLDLPTLSTLEEFLMNYPGVLMIVSHDRYFMDKLVTQLFVFEGEGEISLFNGNYSEYRIYQKLLKEKEQESVKVKKEVNQLQAQTQAPKNQDKKKLSFKEQREIEMLEKEMTQLEEEKTAIEVFLNTSPDANFEVITQNSKRLLEIDSLLDSKMNRWLVLSE